MNILQDILNGSIGPLSRKSAKSGKKAAPKVAPLQHIKGRAIPAAQSWQSPITGATNPIPNLKRGGTVYSPGEGPFVPSRRRPGNGSQYR